MGKVGPKPGHGGKGGGRKKILLIPLEEARQLARRYGLVSSHVWKREVLARGWPSCVPLNPDVYSNDPEWEGGSEFFRRAKMVTFSKARRYARSLGLESMVEWYRHVDSGKCPVTIPREPRKYVEFVSTADWVGKTYRHTGGGIKHIRLRKFWSYEDTRAWVISEGIANSTEWTTRWNEMSRGGDKIPEGIPRNPKCTYGKEWRGWRHFCGLPAYYTYEEALVRARGYGISGNREWAERANRGDWDERMPRSPNSVYSEDWPGWTVWLGNTNTVSISKRRFRRIVRRVLKTTKWTEYNRLRMSAPVMLPVSPASYFPDWKGWLFEFGISFASFERVRGLVRQLKIKSATQFVDMKSAGELPHFVPRTPDRVYRDSGWKGWEDFLDTPLYAELNRKRGLREFHRKRVEEKKARLEKRMSEYEALRDRVHYWAEKLHLSSMKEYTRAIDNGLIPAEEGLPRHPYRYFGGAIWKGSCDWIGRTKESFYETDYEKARVIARRLGVKSRIEWEELKKEGRKPYQLPENPSQFYGVRFISHMDFFGYRDSRGTNQETMPFVSYQECRNMAMDEGCRGQVDWWERVYPLLRSKLSGSDLTVPSRPSRTYLGLGWPSWSEFVGSGRKPRRDRGRAKGRIGVFRTKLFNVFIRGDFHYASKGKDECNSEMFELCRDELGGDVSLLWMPHDGRELKLFREEVGIVAGKSLGVQVNRERVNWMKNLIVHLVRRRVIDEPIEIVHGDVDRIVCNGLAGKFDVGHLDYCGPMIDRHAEAAEKFLLDNPDSILFVTVSRHIRMHGKLSPGDGRFPFIRGILGECVDTLMYRQYRGLKGRLMETFGLRCPSLAGLMEEVEAEDRMRLKL